MNAIELYRDLLHSADDPPGEAFSFGANYAHVLGAEDMAVHGLLLGRPIDVVLGDPAAPAVALGTHSEVRGRASDPARHIVGFETDDIAKECRRLKEAGVEFVEDLRVFGTVWGTCSSSCNSTADMASVRYPQF